MSMDLIDAGGGGGVARRGLIAQAKAEILTEVRQLLAQHVSPTRVRANGVLAPVGTRDTLMFDMAATEVRDDPDNGQVIVPMSSGAGGGTLVKVAEQVIATSGDRTRAIRFPAAGALPTGRHLLLLGQARTVRIGSFGVVAATNLYITCNDDPIDGTQTQYSWEWHEHDGANAIHGTAFTNADYGVQIGYCTSNGSPAGYASDHRVEIPNYQSTAFWKGMTWQAFTPRTDASTRWAFEGGGCRRLTDPITSLTISTSDQYLFDVGTIWTLYALE